jgi:antagonist of KipI
MALWVADPGPFCSLQDLGRRGYQRLGVPVSGAMDWAALTAANRLVGNPAGAAALEFAFRGPSLVAEADCLMAVCGGDSSLRLDGKSLPGWRGVWVRTGQTVQAQVGPNAAWGYLAVNGGLVVPPVLGSASTYLRGGFGGLEGRLLRAGDRLALGPGDGNGSVLAGSRLCSLDWLHPDAEQVVRVAFDVQTDWFEEAGRAALCAAPYALLPESDRMGYRLEGQTIPRRAGEILSEGMCFGSIQVPPNGQPIVMMADRPATGGYPKIAAVIRADLPILVQVRPGSGRVRFRWVTIEEAQAALRRLVAQLKVEWDEETLWMQA